MMEMQDKFEVKSKHPTRAGWYNITTCDSYAEAEEYVRSASNVWGNGEEVAIVRVSRTPLMVVRAAVSLTKTNL